MAETVPDMLAGAARRAGDTRLHFADGDATYAELEAEGRRAAAGLRALGVGPGDRVGFWLPNLRAWIALYAGCCRLGAIAVAMNTRFGRTEVEDVLRRARPRVLAFVPATGRTDNAAILARADPAARECLAAVVQCGGGAAAAIPGTPVVPCAEVAAGPAMAEDLSAPDAPCNIFLTSGTTSLPKLVLHRQDRVVRHAGDAAAAMELGAPGAVAMQALPFCGVFGFVFLMAALRAGAAIAAPQIFEARACAEMAIRHRVTHVAGGDDMFDRMLAEGERLTGGAERPFPSLRRCPYASFNSALADFPERAWRRGMPLLGPFGMSEVFSFFSLRRAGDPPGTRTLGGGFPVNAGARVRARDPETGEILGHGEAGELEAWSPNLFDRYYGDEAATARAFTGDGWFRTGDLGSTAADGSFAYLARMGDALRLGGFLVNPLEIETHLCAHPAVADAQVVAVATARGNRPVAFVVPAPGGGGIDEAALAAHCRGALAGFKVPVRCLPIDAFPVTDGPNGTKIQKTRLRRMAEEAVAAGG